MSQTFDKSIEQLLEAIAKKPGLYVGRLSIDAVSHYLSGYEHALSDLGAEIIPLDGWMEWVQFRFLIRSAAWGWPRILLHVYGSDEAAIKALPSLHKEFMSDRQRLGIDGIELEQKRRLIEAYGEDWHEPSETDTPDPWGG